jgi:hypothetical protein
MTAAVMTAAALLFAGCAKDDAGTETEEPEVTSMELSLSRLVLAGSTDAEGMEGLGVGYIEEFKSAKGD